MGYLVLMAYVNNDTLREAILMSVPGPTAGILSFASPKESIQKKATRMLLDPALRCFRRGSAKGAFCPFADVRHPWRTPDGLFPAKTTVLGAAKREKTRPSAFFRFALEFGLVPKLELGNQPNTNYLILLVGDDRE